MPSDIRHLISHIQNQHLTSEIRQPTSDIRHPTSGIQCLTSEIRYPTSEIRQPTFEIRHSTYDIRHTTFDIRLRTFESMARMCSAWDQATYKVRFERKQCGLFWFSFMFLSFYIVANAYYRPVCSC